MKKLIGLALLLTLFSASTSAQTRNVADSDPAFVMMDILLYRPVGLIATVVGTGAFVAISPFTALAAIPAPHDAFVKTGHILIFAPAAYTFIRPIGNREFPYSPPNPHHRPTKTAVHKAQPAPVATPQNAVPPVTQPLPVKGL